jgi:hypothetical protein
MLTGAKIREKLKKKHKAHYLFLVKPIKVFPSKKKN